MNATDAGRTWPAAIGSNYVPTPRPPPAAEPAPATLEPLSEEPRATVGGHSRTKREHALRLALTFGEVTAETLQSSLAVGRDAAHKILSRLARSGHLQRLEPGRYAPAARAER